MGQDSGWGSVEWLISMPHGVPWDRTLGAGRYKIAPITSRALVLAVGWVVQFSMWPPSPAGKLELLYLLAEFIGKSTLCKGLPCLCHVTFDGISWPKPMAWLSCRHESECIYGPLVIIHQT